MTQPNPAPTPEQQSQIDKIVTEAAEWRKLVREIVLLLATITAAVSGVVSAWKSHQAASNTNEVKTDTKIAVETAAENKVTATKTLATVTGDPKDEKAVQAAQAQLEQVKAATQSNR